MLKLDTEINLDFGKFFRWWWSELSFLVPASLRAWLGTSSRYLILTPGEGGFAAYLQDETGNRFLANQRDWGLSMSYLPLFVCR